MNLLESLRTAIMALTSNKLRAALTMLGIIIGVGAVITLSSLGKGVEAMVNENLQGLGSNLVIIAPSPPEDASGPAYLTTTDAEALADPFNAPALADVASAVGGSLRVTHGEDSAVLSVNGTNPEYARVRSLEPSMGSFLTAADLEDRARVAVLGWTAYTDLFSEGEYPVGQSINVDGTRFRVVGVLKEKGGMGALGSEDQSIYVPLTTAHVRLFPQRTLSGEQPVSTIYATAVDEDQTESAEQQITDLLRERHRLDPDDEADFNIITMKEVLDISGQITGVMTLFLGAIAGISLLVGGIGIMNIMLVTVTERTREIGIRKAVGATRGAILVQFLIEALVLTLVGGLVGITLGVTASDLLARVLEVSPRVTPGMVALAAGVCCVVGLSFGVYPAMRAAQLRPIEALRYE